MCMLIKFKILYSKWKIEDTHSTFNMDLMRGMEYGICLISPAKVQLIFKLCKLSKTLRLL